MKFLTTEQLRAVITRYDSPCSSEKAKMAILAIDDLIEAECREHGFAGIEDAYRVLIEDKT